MNLILLVSLLLGRALEVNAQATLSMNDVKLKPGETAEVSICMNNSVDIQIASFQILLSEGLSLVSAYYDEDYEDYRVMQFVSDRKPKRGQLEENQINDNTINVLAYSAADGGVFKGTEGAILTFQIKALEETSPGSYNITLTGRDKLVSPDELGYNQEDVVANVTVYQVVGIKASSEGHGSVSGGGEYEVGTEVTLTATPDEGYHFVRWSDGSKDNPYTFVINEAIELSAIFDVNRYRVLFSVDGEVVMVDSVAFGATVTVPEVPEKEGHTFAGWGDVPISMPAKDLSFTGSYIVNRYAITYKVDGEVYKTDSLAYNTPITAEPAPEKEGHTFCGWSELPTAMPASDITITGEFVKNKYLITFRIGDEVISSDSLEYGATIVVPEAPEKEGHTFNGWGDVADIVPANDLTYKGNYLVNSYLLTYIVDGETIQVDSVAYGTVITLIKEPTKEGHTFSGWSEVPETMPAYDVAISGRFTINQYIITYVVDGEIFVSDTVNYGETIVVPDVPIKDGYDFSWIDEVPETMPAKNIVINGVYNPDASIIDITKSNEILYIYTIEGQCVNELCRGANIILMRDGTIRKLFVK